MRVGPTVWQVSTPPVRDEPRCVKLILAASFDGLLFGSRTIGLALLPDHAVGHEHEHVELPNLDCVGDGEGWSAEGALSSPFEPWPSLEGKGSVGSMFTSSTASVPALVAIALVMLLLGVVARWKSANTHVHRMRRFRDDVSSSSLDTCEGAEAESQGEQQHEQEMLPSALPGRWTEAELEEHQQQLSGTTERDGAGVSVSAARG